MPAGLPRSELIVVGCLCRLIDQFCVVASNRHLFLGLLNFQGIACALLSLEFGEVFFVGSNKVFAELLRQ